MDEEKHEVNVYGKKHCCKAFKRKKTHSKLGFIVFVRKCLCCQKVLNNLAVLGRRQCPHLRFYQHIQSAASKMVLIYGLWSDPYFG